MNKKTHPDETTLYEFLDGELSEQLTFALEQHIHTCRQCAAQLETMRSLFALIESPPPAPLQVDLAERVVEQIRARRAAWRSPWLRPIVGMQLVVAMLVLAVLWPSMADSLALMPDQVAWKDIQGGWSNAWNTSLAGWRQQIKQFSTDSLSWGDQISQSVLLWQEWFTIPELLSPELLYGLLAAICILWLAGNSLLLRAFQSGTHSQVQRR